MFHDAVCLPSNYTPPATVAVLGRGKRYIKHEGNRRLRELVQAELPAYLASTNRKDKSAIILRVIDTMRNETEGQVGFVRHDTVTGKWLLVDDGTARVSVAQTFRDALSKYYRSSKQYKQKKRRAIKEQRTSSPSPEEQQAKEEKNGNDTKGNTCQLEGTKSMPLSSLVLQPRQVPSSSATTGICGQALLSKVLGDADRILNPIPSNGADTQAVFDSLFKAFAEDVVMDGNPYEPTPIVLGSTQTVPSETSDVLSLDEFPLNTFVV